MSETWFIGDTHFGHANILEYERVARPFNSLDEMHEAMVKRWNSVVGKYDRVFHLGDFCFGRTNIEVAGRLNGQKRLILGNHDTYGADEYLKYFLSLDGAVYEKIHDKKYLLTHVPVHPCNLSGRAEFNIHGHLHSKYVMLFDQHKTGKWIEDPRFINASCEQNNLTPINAEEIFKRERA